MDKLRSLGLWLDGVNYWTVIAVVAIILTFAAGVLLPSYVGLVLAFGLCAVAAAILAR